MFYGSFISVLSQVLSVFYQSFHSFGRTLATAAWLIQSGYTPDSRSSAHPPPTQINQSPQAKASSRYQKHTLIRDRRPISPPTPRKTIPAKAPYHFFAISPSMSSTINRPTRFISYSPIFRVPGFFVILATSGAAINDRPRSSLLRSALHLAEWIL